MTDFFTSTSLLLTLLNPFLLTVYLADVFHKLERRQLMRVLLRAGLISSAVFGSFAVLGDAIFSNFFQADFASFQIFGGIVFLIIGTQFVFRGPSAIEGLRGESEHLAGSIAMPVLIGPGTISASVVIGERHEPWVACASVAIAVALCLATLVVLKALHDFVRSRRARLIERYFEIAGRITALFVGTIAVQMIMQGLWTWARKF